ncbi:hypothetical protein GCM10010112_49790 [Actinoplanes lobatus]|uniref:Uncharacterized protein n=1 Tax=Actinoplanes lobatus TaxID=113568 RepID=A0A7W7HPF9_9ACTN|nr:hypothetical protein [Actinoplanes lobatus]MBB4754139.1 hypothetical protein [Actinoplanes lobatus]GGN77071.1 hypothetical protein GCM10010112_49790 [Actinoplanes lobatus]GIE40806.1 hypothetical protein Alo02nite_37040 [Actinoplanes lobatus]
MFWRRISAHRALAAHNSGRWTGVHVLHRRSPRRPSPCAVPGQFPEPVYREPESAWWEAQEEGGPVTVVVLSDGDAAGVLDGLAGLAEGRLLLVVGWADADTLITGLARLLPRRRMMVLPAHHGEDWLRGNAAIVAGSLLDGVLPILVTHTAALHAIAADLSGRLHADRVLRVQHTPFGAGLLPVWRRRESLHPYVEM